MSAPLSNHQWFVFHFLFCYLTVLHLLYFLLIVNRFPTFFTISRMYSLVDSSRVSTFLISMLLIVYGSFRLGIDFVRSCVCVSLRLAFNLRFVSQITQFRSLNMEQEAKLKEKEAQCEHSESSKSGRLSSSFANHFDLDPDPVASPRLCRFRPLQIGRIVCAIVFIVNASASPHLSRFVARSLH